MIAEKRQQPLFKKSHKQKSDQKLFKHKNDAKRWIFFELTKIKHVEKKNTIAHTNRKHFVNQPPPLSLEINGLLGAADRCPGGEVDAEGIGEVGGRELPGGDGHVGVLHGAALLRQQIDLDRGSHRGGGEGRSSRPREKKSVSGVGGGGHDESWKKGQGQNLA